MFTYDISIVSLLVRVNQSLRLLFTVLHILSEDKPKPERRTSSEIYAQTCRKLRVRPLPSIINSLKQSSDVVAPNKYLNALDMLSLANALTVGGDFNAFSY